jgi:hypothetical protein
LWIALPTTTAFGSVTSSRRTLTILTDSESSDVTVPIVPPISTMSPRRSARYTSTMPLMIWLTIFADPSVTMNPNSTDKPLNTSLCEPECTDTQTSAPAPRPRSTRCAA